MTNAQACIAFVALVKSGTPVRAYRDNQVLTFFVKAVYLRTRKTIHLASYGEDQ